MGTKLKKGNALSGRARVRLLRIRSTYLKTKCLGLVERPPGVSANAFVLKLAGHCLVPRLRDGQRVIVEDILPEPGEFAVVWLKGEQMPIVKIVTHAIYGFPVHRDSEVVTMLYIEQLNPPRRFMIPMDKVRAIARAIAAPDHLRPLTEAA